MYDTAAAEFWDAIYRNRPGVALPKPNVRLTEFTSTLTPGTALDLGSGHGGDAVWLAQRGWQVTAVDISAIAVDRLNELAADLDLGSQLIASRIDLQAGFPPGSFSLINAHYLHTTFHLDKIRILRDAAHALIPAGHLLLVDHGSTAPWSWQQDPAIRYPQPDEIWTELNLAPTGWTLERAAALQRMATGPGGQIAPVTDHVLLIRRQSEDRQPQP